jgi:gamma-glutamylcysteine synthetase
VPEARRRTLEAVLRLYPTVAPSRTRVGIELECFVEGAEGQALTWSEHLRRQDHLWRPMDGRASTVASLALEPGGQWEMRSVPLEGPAGLRAFARDVARVEELLRDQGCRVCFQGVRPGGPRATVISPEPRTALLRAYLERRSVAAAEMMADTAACQLTLDPLPLADTLRLLRAVVSTEGELQRRWNAAARQPSRRGIWGRVDPERCVPPRGMIDGTWSDEACLDHILSLPCIVVQRADGRLVPFEGSFYEAMSAFPGGDIADRFGRFMKHVYYAVKPRILAELRPLDSRPPDELPELAGLLAELSLPGWGTTLDSARRAMSARKAEACNPSRP